MMSLYMIRAINDESNRGPSGKRFISRGHFKFNSLGFRFNIKFGYLKLKIK